MSSSSGLAVSRRPSQPPGLCLRDDDEEEEEEDDEESGDSSDSSGDEEEEGDDWLPAAEDGRDLAPGEYFIDEVIAENFPTGEGVPTQVSRATTPPSMSC